MSTITGTIDPGVISMVKFFNENGLPTHMSCQGHNKTTMSMFWIEFDRSVTEDNILNFMKDPVPVFQRAKPGACLWRNGGLLWGHVRGRLFYSR